MWEHPYIAFVSLNIFGPGTVFNTDACHVFLQCVVTLILLIVSALDIEQGLLFALYLSQPCWGWGLLPSYCSGSPQIGFWAVVWGRWDWGASAGSAATVYSSTEAVHQEVGSVVLPVTCHVHYPQPHLSWGGQAVTLDIPQVLCSQNQ